MRLCYLAVGQKFCTHKNLLKTFFYTQLLNAFDDLDWRSIGFDRAFRSFSLHPDEAIATAQGCQNCCDRGRTRSTCAAHHVQLLP